MNFPGLEMNILKCHDFSRFSMTVRTLTDNNQRLHHFLLTAAKYVPCSPRDLWSVDSLICLWSVFQRHCRCIQGSDSQSQRTDIYSWEGLTLLLVAELRKGADTITLFLGKKKRMHSCWPLTQIKCGVSLVYEYQRPLWLYCHSRDNTHLTERVKTVGTKAPLRRRVGGKVRHREGKRKRPGLTGNGIQHLSWLMALC